VKLHEWMKSVIDSTPGLTQKGLAEAMDLNPAAVNRMLYGARKIKVDELPVIEKYLGRRYKEPDPDHAHRSLPNQQEVFGSAELSMPYGGYRDPGRPPSFRYGEQASWAENMVPVYGYTAGGLQTDLNLAKGEIVDWATRHPALNGIRDAFAVYVFSDSMVPRYFPGELVYVHPGRPPEQNKDCIVELKNGDAYLKCYLGQNNDEVRFTQYNPAEEISFAKSDIQALYAIVGRS
jgi:SOS-response transcriptional repressor LexA